jgi:putative lipoprotein
LPALLAVLFCAAPAAADDDWWGPDKGLHFGVSAGLAAGGYGLSALVLDEPWQRAVAGGATALTLGVSKEIYDATGRGDPSGRDLAWNFAGVAVGVSLALSVDLLVRHRRLRREKEEAYASLSHGKLRW